MSNNRDTTELANAAQEDPPAQTNKVVGPTSLSKVDWRIAAALFLGAILWMAPYIASIAILMPAKVAGVAPEHRIALVTALNVGGAVLGLVGNVVFGALSDMTRSRFGRRVPWMLGGALGTGFGLVGFSVASNVPLMVFFWSIYILALNAIIAPMVAVLSDRVPEKYRATVSAIYGVGVSVGAAVSMIGAAGFIGDPQTGLFVFAALSFLSAIVFVAIAPRESNKDALREHRTLREAAAHFRPPARGARDFYCALVGKFFLQAGLYAITNFQLFILLDYIKLNQAEAAGIISVGATIGLVATLTFGIGAGPLSDRVGRRKPFVIASALLIAVGLLFPLFAPFAWAMVVYAIFSGIGNAAYGSVDQALNIEVLPSTDAAAKDLGILNLANTGGQIVGPIVSSVMVTLSGGYQGAFMAAIVLLVLSALLIVPIRSVR